MEKFCVATSLRFIERRRCVRLSLDARPRILIDVGPDLFECRSIDVSPQGLGVIGQTALAPDAKCMVSFDLRCRGEQKRINACGRVVASTPVQVGQYRTGIRFTDMDSSSRERLECLARHSCQGDYCGAGLRMKDPGMAE